ncbi:MAG: hypothetical protein P8184_07855 [Calditrichia bacterium]
MDHVVYLDAAGHEYEKMLAETKTMIIRGAAGRKMPYGRVSDGDMLYFMNNDGEGLVKLKARVKTVFNSGKMSFEESAGLVGDNQNLLQLEEKQIKRWAGKRYLVLITVEDVREIDPFPIDKSSFGNMDDWLPVGDINRVKL